MNKNRLAPWLLPLTAMAADSVAKEGTVANAQNQIEEIEHIRVIGRHNGLQKEAGAIALIDEAQLEKFEFDDIHRVLTSIPGINIQEEDGYGLRPNIGFRGTTPERSKKINIMEDGVLIGPAPYSAPAAYYFPTVSRMTSVEVVKGPAAVKYGPNTVAGTLNLTTRAVPTYSEGMIDVALGTDGYGKFHGYYGNNIEMSSTDGLGFLVEALHSRADGFKEIDNASNSLYDEDTGFDKNDLTAKVKYDFNTHFFGRNTDQSIELKLGYSDENSNETYLGITDGDFSVNPNRRYAASQAANMQWDHQQAQITYVIKSEDFTLTTRAYRNDFERAWRKLNSFNNDQASLSEVITNPTLYPELYQVLIGEIDSEINELEFIMGTNDRSYYSQGLMSDLTLTIDAWDIQHTIDAGVRFHNDRIDRNHFVQNYQMLAGVITPVTNTLKFTSVGNFEEADALSVYLQNTMRFEQLEVTIGGRSETVVGRSQAQRYKRTTTLLGSLSAFYSINDEVGVYAGIHQGYVPTSPGQDVSLEPETSVNYELGGRYNDGVTAIETTLFFNDVENLKESCSFSVDPNCGQGDNLDRDYNGGEVDVLGLELSAKHRFELNSFIDVPVGLTYTYTEGEFKHDLDSTFSMWGAVKAGDPLPYLPEQQVALNLGLESTNWQVNLLVKYTDEMFEASGQGVTLTGKKTDDFVMVDLSAGYDFNENSGVYFKIDNLLDEVAIVSRRPYGARPTKPQQVFAGYKYRF